MDKEEQGGGRGGNKPPSPLSLGTPHTSTSKGRGTYGTSQQTKEEGGGGVTACLKMCTVVCWDPHGQNHGASRGKQETEEQNKTWEKVTITSQKHQTYQERRKVNTHINSGEVGQQKQAGKTAR